MNNKITSYFALTIHKPQLCRIQQGGLLIAIKEDNDLLCAGCIVVV